jgi:hypothetical protein
MSAICFRTQETLAEGHLGFQVRLKKIINGKNLNINTHFPLFKFFNVFKANLVRIFGERICDVCNCCYTVDRGRS